MGGREQWSTCSRLNQVARPHVYHTTGPDSTFQPDLGPTHSSIYMMRLSAALSLVLSLLFSLGVAAETDKHIDIFAWPVSASKSQTLAKLSYSSEQATVLSYKAPALPAGEEIVRIGFHHPTTGKWSGIATSAENFEEGKDKKIQLLLNEQGEVYHVGFTTSRWPSSSKGGSKKEDLSVEVVPMKAGSPIHLNKPVVLNAEGKLEGKEEEKTFLQKYVPRRPHSSNCGDANVYQVLVGHRSVLAFPAGHERRKGVEEIRTIQFISPCHVLFRSSSQRKMHAAV